MTVRVLLAKPGLDGHDRGLKVVAMGLRDAGAEVVYLGQRQTADRIVAAAVAEDVDVIGLSILSGAHLSLARAVLIARAGAGIDDVPVVVGGIIPPSDVALLVDLGVAAVFPSGSALPDVVRDTLALGTARQAALRVTDPRDRLEPASTASGIPVRPLYEQSDLGDQPLADRLGRPGEAPFTRGPYPTMYRERLWTMRQYAGYGGSEDTNARYRFLLGQGQTALSVAFDLPTQLGYDSDHPMAKGEVGRVGVAIDTADDMAAVFDGLPLDQLSVNFTINATAPMILACYLVAAERQGVPFDRLTGTLQNDILKEFLARKTYIYPPRQSVRLVGDVVAWAARHLPRFNPISVTGYHAREAGCDAVQELGLTMASAIAYCDALVARGLDIDEFAPRLSFHFATTLDLFEEVAKLRAARRLWHRIATERFGATDPDSGRLRFFSGCSGATLTAQQPLNNVIRSTIQCLGAVLGGAQSIHVMGYDEALQIPSEEAVTLALRTQQIVAHESGVTRSIDPLAGSFYVEHLTDEIERRAEELVQAIDELGGAVAAIEAGVPQRWIARAAYEAEQSVASGATVKVGVNAWTSDDEEATELHWNEVDPDAEERIVARLLVRRSARDGGAVEQALAALDERTALDERAVGDDGLMPPLLDAARAGATIGEMADVLRARFGEYVEPSPW